jgi:hypothetical protein
MKNFSIFGERCSGTHFVKFAILRNFHIDFSQANTHFFGFDNDSDFENKLDDTFYICLVRHPIDWIDSFFKRAHHVPEHNFMSIDNFLKNEFYSIYEVGEKINQELMEDRHLITKERYKNIFELRKTKLDYFLNVIPTKAKHFIFLRYEDLRDNYQETLDVIAQKFNLIKKYDNYVEIVKYKGTYDALYFKKPILLSNDDKEYIKQNVDVEQEKKFGYLL